MTDYDAGLWEVLRVNYIYDAFDRLIGRQVDYGGDGIDRSEAFIYDGDQIVLTFGDDDSGPLAADLEHRYLWGPAVDQLLADEAVTSLGVAGLISWTLGDHQNTVRDVVQYISGTTNLVNHNVYDSFGNKLSQSAPTHDVVFGYTGRYVDPDTGLQWNGSTQGGGRWYDQQTGRWLSEDRIGFAGDASNLYRYVLNGATMYVDATGLEETSIPVRPNGSTTPIHNGIDPHVLQQLQNSQDGNRVGPRHVPGDPKTAPKVPPGAQPFVDYERQMHAASQDRPNQSDVLGPLLMAGAEVAAGCVPGVGEAMDVAVIVDSEEPWWARVLAGGSLVASVFTLGLTPNAGGAIRGGRRLAGEAAEEGVEGAARAGAHAATPNPPKPPDAPKPPGSAPTPPRVPDPNWRQSTPDSQRLARNLGIEPGSGQAAHHVVPGGIQRAQPSRDLLNHYQIDINCADNGVPLVGGKGAPQGTSPRHHRGSNLHTDEGIDALNDRLRAATNGVTDWATGRAAVLAELERIRRQTLNGTFP